MYVSCVCISCNFGYRPCIPTTVQIIPIFLLSGCQLTARADYSLAQKWLPTSRPLNKRSRYPFPFQMSRYSYCRNCLAVQDFLMSECKLASRSQTSPFEDLEQKRPKRFACIWRVLFHLPSWEFLCFGCRFRKRWVIRLHARRVDLGGWICHERRLEDMMRTCLS